MFDEESIPAERGNRVGMRSHQGRGPCQTRYLLRPVRAQNPRGAESSADHPLDRLCPDQIASFEQGRGDPTHERQPRLSTGTDTLGQLIKQRFDSGLVVTVSGVVLLRRQQDQIAPYDLFVKRDARGFALPTETVAFGV